MDFFVSATLRLGVSRIFISYLSRGLDAFLLPRPMRYFGVFLPPPPSQASLVLSLRHNKYFFYQSHEYTGFSFLAGFREFSGDVHRQVNGLSVFPCTRLFIL